MIDLKEIKAQQQAIQEQGQRLLKHVPIELICNTYGDYQIGGSFKHSLMLASKADIDGYILVDDKIELMEGLELLGELVKIPEVKRTAIEKNFDGTSEHTLPHLTLQVKIPFEDHRWNFDIQIINRKDFKSFSYLDFHSYTESQRLVMLSLKAELYQRRLYPGSTKLPNSFSSVDVYRAVLEFGVATDDEMIAWGKTHPTLADAWKLTH